MKGLTVEEYQQLLLSVGTHRNDRPLSPLEVARMLRKAITAGRTRAECAEALGISPSQVSSLLNLLEIAPEIQHFADWRGSNSASIAFSTMAELRRLRQSDQIVAANAALSHNMTWKETVQLAQISIRSREPIEECISRVLSLRPQIVTRHMFVGAVTNSDLHAWLETLPQTRRDELISKAVQKLTGSNYVANARLGVTQFTILSDHDLSNLLSLQPNAIESSINFTLAEARG